MSSLAEVARHAGVSKATASRALSGAAHVSDATRARVAASAAELGFVASTSAASLVTGRTRKSPRRGSDRREPVADGGQSQPDGPALSRLDMLRRRRLALE